MPVKKLFVWISWRFEMKQTEIFQKLIEAWINKDVKQFLSVCDEGISYTESFGAQYCGKVECEKWFIHWNSPVENKVESWDIKASHFDGEIGFFTWNFKCVYEGKEEQFDGCSLVKFSGNLIVELQEFAQEQRKFRPYKVK